MPRWDRDVAGRLISRCKVTSWTNIPTMVIDLLASPNFAQLRPEQPRLHRRRRRGHAAGRGAAPAGAVRPAYQEGYGLTETAAPSHANPFENPKQQCLGIPYMSTDSRVVDPDTLQEMPVGRIGRDHHPRPRGVPGLLEAARRDGRGLHRVRGQALLPLRRHGPHGRGRLLLHDRPPQAHDQRERLQGLAGRGGSC